MMSAMFGKRPDGIRVKGIDPVMRITPYVMPMRCDAQVLLKHRADMEILSRYIRRQKREKNETITYMQIIVAAYVRAVSRNPEVNRFIMNKQLFARNNCSAAFTILKDPSDADKGEAVVKIKFDLTDTLYDVRDRMCAAVNANRGNQPAGFVDKLLGGLFAVPGLATVIDRCPCPLPGPLQSRTRGPHGRTALLCRHVYYQHRLHRSA